MNNQKTCDWLAKRGIVLEESFTACLRNLAAVYQKENNICCLDDVYKLIGIRKQLVLYWETNPHSTQTKNF